MPKALKVILTILALLAGVVLLLVVLAWVWPQFGGSVSKLVWHVIGEIEYIITDRF